jgi:hypothetical protein
MLSPLASGEAIRRVRIIIGLSCVGLEGIVRKEDEFPEI